MNEVIIRHVTSKDLLDCVAVEESGFLPEEAASLETIQLRMEMFREGFLVAESHGKVIGMLNSGATDKDDISDEELKQLIGHNPDGQNLVVFALAILPDFRNQGIARKLMSKFVDEARACKRKNILLLCKQELILYYQKLGFEHMGISSSQHGGAEWHQMRLRL